MAQTISSDYIIKRRNDAAVQIWGSLESPASKEFVRRAVPLDLSHILKSPKSIVQHYQLDGTCFSMDTGRGYLEVKDIIDIKENDIVIASFPKTGTTWVQEITYSLLHKDELDKPITENIDVRSPMMEYPECGFRGLLSRPSPKMLKTHLPYELLPNGSCNKKYKIIATTRNPKDAALSMAYFMKLLDNFQFVGDINDGVNLFLNDSIIFAPFWRHALGYWNHRHDDNVLIVKYEDLQNDIHNEIKRIAKFLEVEVDDDLVSKIERRCRFEQMASNPFCFHAQWTKNNVSVKPSDLKFMRKGKVGDWKNHFDEETNKRFDEWIEKHLGNSDLKYQYE